VTENPNPCNQNEVVLKETTTATVAYGQASSEVARLWHRRYCDLSASKLRTASNLIEGMAPLRTTDVSSTERALFHSCIVGWMHAAPFKTKDSATSLLVPRCERLSTLSPFGKRD